MTCLDSTMYILFCPYLLTSLLFFSGGLVVLLRPPPRHHPPHPSSPRPTQGLNPLHLPPPTLAPVCRPFSFPTPSPPTSSPAASSPRRPPPLTYCQSGRLRLRLHPIWLSPTMSPLGPAIHDYAIVGSGSAQPRRLVSRWPGPRQRRRFGSSGAWLTGEDGGRGNIIQIVVQCYFSKSPNASGMFAKC